MEIHETLVFIVQTAMPHSDTLWHTRELPISPQVNITFETPTAHNASGFTFITLFTHPYVNDINLQE
jgi:hypothetical protein